MIFILSILVCKFYFSHLNYDISIFCMSTLFNRTLLCRVYGTAVTSYIIPKSLHRNTNTTQTLDSTEKEKIAAEPMGATNIFCFSCETNILHIISRFYVGIWAI